MHGQGKKNDVFSGWLRRYTPIYRPTPAKGMAVDYPFKDVEDEILTAYKVSTKYGHKPTIRSKKEQAFQMGLIVAEPLEGEKDDFTEFEKTEEQKAKEEKAKTASAAELKISLDAVTAAADAKVLAAVNQAQADLAAAQLQSAADLAAALVRAQNDIKAAVTDAERKAALDAKTQVAMAIADLRATLGLAPPPAPAPPILPPGPNGPVPGGPLPQPKYPGNIYPTIRTVGRLPADWKRIYDAELLSLNATDLAEQKSFEGAAFRLYSTYARQPVTDETADLGKFENDLKQEVVSVTSARSVAPKLYPPVSDVQQLMPEFKKAYDNELAQLPPAAPNAVSQLSSKAMQLYKKIEGQDMSDLKKEVSTFKGELAKERVRIVDDFARSVSKYPEAKTVADLPAEYLAAVQGKVTELKTTDPVEIKRLQAFALNTYATEIQGQDMSFPRMKIKKFKTDLKAEVANIESSRIQPAPDDTYKAINDSDELPPEFAQKLVTLINAYGENDKARIDALKAAATAWYNTQAQAGRQSTDVVKEADELITAVRSIVKKLPKKIDAPTPKPTPKPAPAVDVKLEAVLQKLTKTIDDVTIVLRAWESSSPIMVANLKAPNNEPDRQSKIAEVADGIAQVQAALDKMVQTHLAVKDEAVIKTNNQAKEKFNRHGKLFQDLKSVQTQLNDRATALPLEPIFAPPVGMSPRNTRRITAANLRTPSKNSVNAYIDKLRSQNREKEAKKLESLRNKAVEYKSRLQDPAFKLQSLRIQGKMEATYDKYKLEVQSEIDKLMAQGYGKPLTVPGSSTGYGRSRGLRDTDGLAGRLGPGARSMKQCGSGKTHLQTYYDQNIQSTGEGKRKRKAAPKASAKRSRKKTKSFDEDDVTPSRGSSEGIYFLTNKSY